MRAGSVRTHLEAAGIVCETIPNATYGDCVAARLSGGGSRDLAALDDLQHIGSTGNRARDRSPSRASARHGYEETPPIGTSPGCRVAMWHSSPAPIYCNPTPSSNSPHRQDDPGVREFLICVAPPIEVAERRAGPRTTRALKPRMLIRCVIDDQLGDDPKIATMRLADKGLEIRHTAERGMDVLVIGDVVAVVAQWRG